MHPEFNEWKKENDIDQNMEELLINYMTAEDFPELEELEKWRTEEKYNVRWEDNKKYFEQLSTEARKIASSILEQQEKKKIKELGIKKEGSSFLSKIKEKLGFNQGGIADINYLTRRL